MKKWIIDASEGHWGEYEVERDPNVAEPQWWHVLNPDQCVYSDVHNNSVFDTEEEARAELEKRICASLHSKKLHIDGLMRDVIFLRERLAILRGEGQIGEGQIGEGQI